MPISLTEVQLFTNNAVSLLASPISATSTSLTVIPGQGDLFPLPNINEFFLITLEDQAATVREIIKVTGRTGDTLHFLLADRGQEGTLARAWASTSGNETLVDHRITAETMDRAMELPLTGATTLGELTDVDVTTPPAIGQTIKFNGTKWVPANDSAPTFDPSTVSIDVFSDVSSTGASTGQVLTWNGTNWVPSAPPSISISQLSDVDSTTLPASIGQVLKWNGTKWASADDNIGSGSTGSSLLLYTEKPVAQTAPFAGGDNSIAIGDGASTEAAARNSIAIGRFAITRLPFSMAYAQGRFSGNGDCQEGKYLLRGVTTTDIESELFIDGALQTLRLSLPDDSTWNFEARVTAHRTDVGDGHAGYTFNGVIFRRAGAATVAFQGAPTKVVLAESNKDWDVNIVADTATGSLGVRVKGQLGKTIRWAALITTLEVTN